MTGRLATVEPARRRITLVPIGESQIVELQVADGAAIVEAERELTLTDLVVEVGSLMHVEFRREGGQRIADRLTITAAVEGAPAPSAATVPSCSP